jgi:hypothetical protein
MEVQVVVGVVVDLHQHVLSHQEAVFQIVLEPVVQVVGVPVQEQTSPAAATLLLEVVAGVAQGCVTTGLPAGHKTTAVMWDTPAATLPAPPQTLLLQLPGGLMPRLRPEPLEIRVAVEVA